MSGLKSDTRTLFWSVRRELWEHTYLYKAPLAMAALLVVGLLVTVLHLPRIIGFHFEGNLPPDMLYMRTYLPVILVLLFTSTVIGPFYCLDALSGERRDRSILFWKSMPVSDFTVVLSKAAIPLVFLPGLIGLLIILVELADYSILLVEWIASGSDAAPLPEGWGVINLTLTAFFALCAQTLWWAPVYCWLLAVSAWAGRAVFLWAFLGPVAACVVEKIVFGTQCGRRLIEERLFGSWGAAFQFTDSRDIMFTPWTGVTVERFFTDPDLWLGIAIAAGFFAAAVILRRFRGPDV